MKRYVLVEIDAPPDRQEQVIATIVRDVGLKFGGSSARSRLFGAHARCYVPSGWMTAQAVATQLSDDWSPFPEPGK